MAEILAQSTVYGESPSSYAYAWVKAPPGHPRASKGRVLEHIIIAEKVLGRPLPAQAQVHHVDQNGSNNANDNLVICQDHAYHKLLHRRTRAYLVCGDANGLICQYCHRYDSPRNLTVKAATAGRRSYAYHPECLREHSRDDYAKNRERIRARQQASRRVR